jgi:hypothetical protein
VELNAQRLATVVIAVAVLAFTAGCGGSGKGAGGGEHHHSYSNSVQQDAYDDGGGYGLNTPAECRDYAARIINWSDVDTQGEPWVQGCIDAAYNNNIAVYNN